MSTASDRFAAQEVDSQPISESVLAFARDARRILAVTDDGRRPAYARTRSSAIRLAATVGADLIFYDRSAESRFVDSYPSGSWTADNDGPHGERLLDASEVRALGRGYLAAQIGEATERGVHARAWLPRHVGGRGIDECVGRFDATLVMVPDVLDHPSLLDRLRGHPERSLAVAINAPTLVVGSAGELRVAGTWRVDRTASHLAFTARQFGAGRVRGRFTDFALALDYDEERPDRSFVEATVEAASIRTGIGIRDRALRGRRFLDVGSHPSVRFVSTTIEPSDGHFRIEGELTIREASRRVELDARIEPLGPDPAGRRRVRFRGSTSVRWRDWGVEGVFFVGPELAIDIDVQAVEARGQASSVPHFTGRPGGAG